MQVVEVSTTNLVISTTIDRQNRDAIRYATNIQAQHDLGADNIRLDSDFVELANAREKLKSVDELTEPMLDGIATNMASQILDQLDQKPSVADPSELEVDFLIAEEGE